MNQILLTENKNDKNNKYKNSNNSKDMRTIIIFFGVVILVFGLALAGVCGYKTYNKNKKKEVIVGKPDLSLVDTEDFVTIIAKSEIGINKIIYKWNDEETNEVEMSEKGTSHEEKIDIPSGKNTLNVKVIDKNGQEKEESKEFINDKEKPSINTDIVEDEQMNKFVKVVATDDTEMKYITYRWNDEEEVKVEVENKGDKLIETEIEIIRGNSILTIVATDSVNNTKEVEKPFIASLEPEFDVRIVDDKVYMKIIHDMGFEKIEFSVNGKVYTYDSNYSGYDSTQKEIEFYEYLKEGQNNVKIVATSNEGSSKTYDRNYNYTPE